MMLGSVHFGVRFRGLHSEVQIIWLRPSTLLYKISVRELEEDETISREQLEEEKKAAHQAQQQQMLD